MPHTQSLMSQQRVPSWFPGLKRPAKAPLPAPSAQRQRSIDQGLQRGVRGPRQSFPVLTSQEVNTTISVALRHFGLSWEALDVAQLGTIREAARSVSDMEGGVFPEQLHAAILGTLRQRREQPVLIDTTSFVDAAHANSRARAESGIYGGITINGAHRGPDGTPLHYLEQGPAWCSALHACNAMVGAPVLALADIGVHEARKQAPGMNVSDEAVQQAMARMREHGVPLSSVLEVLQDKLGIATHVYQHIPVQHIPVVEDDGSSSFNHEQADLLDEIDAGQLLLEMTTPSGAKLCAAFHKDGADWTQQDVVKGETTPSFPPSLYLRLEDAIGFTAAWLRQGLSASGMPALPLDSGAGALRHAPPCAGCQTRIGGCLRDFGMVPGGAERVPVPSRRIRKTSHTVWPYVTDIAEPGCTPPAPPLAGAMAEAATNEATASAATASGRAGDPCTLLGRSLGASPACLVRGTKGAKGGRAPVSRRPQVIPGRGPKQVARQRDCRRPETLGNVACVGSDGLGRGVDRDWARQTDPL